MQGTIQYILFSTKFESKRKCYEESKSSSAKIHLKRYSVFGFSIFCFQIIFNIIFFHFQTVVRRALHELWCDTVHGEGHRVEKIMDTFYHRVLCDFRRHFCILRHGRYVCIPIDTEFWQAFRFRGFRFPGGGVVRRLMSYTTQSRNIHTVNHTKSFETHFSNVDIQLLRHII